MELLADEFNEHLAIIGQRCEWRRSFACPCGTSASGGADPTCRACGGMGHVWEEPVRCVVGKTGADARKRWAQMGLYMEGDTTVSIGSDQPCYAIAAFDRVLMLDQTEPFSFKVAPGINERFNFTVIDVEKVLGVDPVTGALVNLGLPDVDALGKLSWPGGAPVGNYSITGRRFIEFFAWTNQPFDRPHELGEPLPRRIVLRRFDLFGRAQ